MTGMKAVFVVICVRVVISDFFFFCEAERRKNKDDTPKKNLLTAVVQNNGKSVVDGLHHGSKVQVIEIVLHLDLSKARRHGNTTLDSISVVQPTPVEPRRLETLVTLHDLKCTLTVQH